MSAGARLASTPEPMHHWDGAGGLRLAGDVWGDPDGPLVVLQHGGGQTRHAWKGTGTTLARAGYHVIAIDTRGHGDSDWDPHGDYSHDAMVDDLARVVADLDQRPILVGASLGGVVSVVAVGEGHLDAAALVLVDVVPRLEPAGVEAVQAFMSRNPDGFASLGEVAHAIARFQPHRARRTSHAGLAKNVRLREDGRLHWHWDPRFQSANRDLDARQARLERCARSLRLPTLLVHGGLSEIVTVDAAEEFLELCPHAEYVQVAGARHMTAGDRNDSFSEAVIDFLSRTVPTEESPRRGPRPTAP